MSDVRISFKVSPDTKAMIRQFTKNAREFHKFANKINRDLAYAVTRRVKGIIVRQEFTPLELTPEWRAFKEKMGWDDRTLLASHAYIKSIKPKKGQKDDWAVEANALLASVLEEQRPHWGLAVDQVQNEAPKIVEETVRKLIMARPL